jgi:hypothetical protein
MIFYKGFFFLNEFLWDFERKLISLTYSLLDNRGDHFDGVKIKKIENRRNQ